ncbi:MAG: MurR/RpiR family transcriptional regulator [Rothia sp. (in: high G+C Gram-positive bacteria)]|uniref:MurR/RpiR family transcriptional regulator n=1 Tax=Rothia sp. (in: high G+C Gram-positive bacteria) TaxID=1885016 RepID=UPI0026DF3CFA|nr:MurR/RpiR family transcriptional regulator [Rothia sp. (in: high G+C Gram-positive bacteria)]MDO5750016.1 MurR/RpiR family transcriptional regulator [Rothia sp. (in: high G+C Gram-positive bacteria)]
MDLQDVVNANQHRFSETEREILAFMLENEEFVAEATINSLAHKTYTSTSSIIRLTKKLNFSGFAELKYFIKSSLSNTEPYNPRFIESGREDILRTYDYLEHMDLGSMLKRIFTARTVYCYGTGYAQRNAVQEFAKSMQICGKFCHIIPARNEFESAMNIMSQDDIVVIVSFSGQTENMREHIKMLQLRKIPMIAITAIGVNYMSSHADFSLHYQSTPTQLSTQRKPFNSFVALSVLLDYIVRRYIDYIETQQRAGLDAVVAEAAYDSGYIPEAEGDLGEVLARARTQIPGTRRIKDV